MAYVASESVAHHLEALFAGGSVAGLSDRQLLERFTACGTPADEAAFAAIVARHGPMVLGVCRQLLGDHHHAEDAFQAVFLVLARQARSIRDPDVLGAWLHGVAVRTARKARARLRRTEEAEAVSEALDRPEARPIVPVERMIAREQAEALHREIDGLPGTFRLAVVLCYLEGLSLAEAARRLRCPAGTVHSRLVRAREKLRRGLLRRGVALSTTAMAAALAPRSASASIPPLLCSSTTRAAIAFAARHAAAGGALSAPAAAMAQEVLRTMLGHKLKAAALSLLLLATLAAGAGYLTHSSVAAERSREGEAPSEPSPHPARPLDLPHPADSPAPGRMTVVGRVLDPQGKPVPGASVMVYASPKLAGGSPAAGTRGPDILGRASCDASGRYRLDMPRISSSTHVRVAASALAPGHGTSWVDLNADADRPTADITLRPEQAIEGRLFDVTGRPAAEVRVAVESMGHAPRGPEAAADGIEGPHFRSEIQAKGLPAWPAAVVTGADGRFTIPGVGRGLRVQLLAEAPRFARQIILVETDGTAGSRTVTAAMEPARVITGRITYGDTGQPVPHAIVDVWAYRAHAGRGFVAHTLKCETDAQGIFRANPLSTDTYLVYVVPPEGQPYLGNGTDIFEWIKGTFERRVDLPLSRAAVIRGKVTEEGTGRPIAGAGLGFMARGPGRGEPGCSARTGPDGSYQLAIRPMPGTLIVLGPGDDFVLQETSRRMINEGQPGGERRYAHAFIPCDLKPGTESHEVNVALRRGETVEARVVGPDGQPVRQAEARSRILFEPQPWPWRFFFGRFHGDVHDGRFALRGLAEGAEVPVFFFDPKNQQGATALFSVKAAKDGPIAVRLEPCGLAMARLVDPKGKPLAGYRNPYLISMVVTPGADRMGNPEADKTALAADQDFLSRIDPERYTNLGSDAQGRITFPALIPGATYRILDDTARNANGFGRRIRKEFIAGAGEALELGDILIEKPEQ